MRVLVVDDEPAVQRAHIRILEAAGYRCDGASSVADARGTLAREPFDIVLVDVRMPGETGLALVEWIAAMHPNVGVIMVTGTADFTSVSDARRAGALDYLVKPVDAGALTGAVARAAAIVTRRARRPAAPETGAAPPPPSAPPAEQRAGSTAEPGIDRLFHAMVERGASDLHLSASVPPLIRLHGEMIPLDAAAPALSAEDVVQLITPIIPGKNRQEFEERHDSDFAYEIDGLARFRGNIFMDRKGMGAVFRTVPTRIMSARELGLSSSILELCDLRKGLVLVTGPTGSGKSTTLAALIDHINHTRADHIVTIEDPIEFVHGNARCLVNQREVHSHTRSFKDALRAALREDPDVVLIGEMRDLETISIALETAETGHLVFGTLHTTTAASTVDRIIDQFSADKQAQVRVMLSESLRAVISQTLCRKIGGGRVAALEVLLVTTAVSNLIREGKTFQIPSVMQVGRAAGMVPLNEALLELVKAGRVAPAEAVLRSVDKAAMTAMLDRTGLSA